MLRWLFGRTRPEVPEPETLREPRLITGFAQVDAFVSNYYLNPRPELVWQLLDFLGTGDNLLTCSPGTIGFLAEFLAAHPERKPQLKALAASRSPMMRQAFAEAERLSRWPGVALSVRDHSGEVNDLHWGAFYASGRPAYLDRLIGEMLLIDDLSDPRVHLTGATARWSLASHARTHEAVRGHLLSAQGSRDGRLGDLIDEALSRDPPELWAEMQSTCEERGWSRR